METLFQEATRYLPEFNFDAENSILQIRGLAIPDGIRHLQPHEKWVDNFLAGKPAEVKLVFSMEFYNNVFDKFVQNIFVLCEKSMEADGTAVEIHWNYTDDDEDMLEAGEEFQVLFPKLNVQLVPVLEL